MALLKQVMKAPNEIVAFDHLTIKYPQLASIKFDGFRCLNLCGDRLLSPALKPIMNRNLVVMLEPFLAHCTKQRIVTDGEIWSPSIPFNELSSIIRSHDKPIPPTVKYHIFDSMSESEWDNESERVFVHRYLEYTQTLAGFENVVTVEQHHITSSEEAETFFNVQLDNGHEGMILRQLNAKYKHGRCTTNQDGMWKFKEFVTHDAIIVGVEQQMRLKQGVMRTLNELGHLERRYEKDLYEPAQMVGAFVVETKSYDGMSIDSQQFKIKPGKGYNDLMKASWWQDYIRDPNKFIGRHVEFKYMTHGTKDKPRIGSLVRFRDDLA